MVVSNSRDLSFEAELVEVFVRDGRHIAKLLVHSFFVEIDAAGIGEAHLGDRVRFHPGAITPAADEEAK
jgi:hypothetical protein